jgi:hypothetical protein
VKYFSWRRQTRPFAELRTLGTTRIASPCRDAQPRFVEPCPILDAGTDHFPPDPSKRSSDREAGDARADDVPLDSQLNYLLQAERFLGVKTPAG